MPDVLTIREAVQRAKAEGLRRYRLINLFCPVIRLLKNMDIF